MVLGCATALGIAGLTTVTSAQGQIRACVQKSSQQTRIIGDGESCRSTETLVTWTSLPTGTVLGRLVRCGAPAGSLAPVSLTLVHVLGQSFTAMTDDDGRFQFRYLPPGDYTLAPKAFFMNADPANPIHLVAGATIDLQDVQTQDLSNDAANCGSCGTSCRGGTCVGSTCQAAPPGCIPTGSEICDGRDNDCDGVIDNGANLCSGGGVCQNAACVAPESCTDGLKNGAETDVDCGGPSCPTCAVGNHCAASSDCVTVANSFPSCTGGVCSFSCTGFFANCDHTGSNGCETDTRTSVANCGACGSACQLIANGSPACAAATCTIGSCQSGFADCNNLIGDGCEINLASNASHCGACGNACPAGQSCSNGKCGADTDTPGQSGVSALQAPLEARRQRR